MMNTKFYSATKYLLLSVMALCLMIGFNKPADAANVKTGVKVLTVGESCTVKNAGSVTSSKKNVASVKDKGNNRFKITALKKGKSTIHIYNSKGKLTKRVYLLSGNKKSFKFSTSTGYLEKGKSATVKASTNMSGVTIQYSSSKPAVASVDAKGKITAKKAGGTYITATFYYKGLKAKAVKKPVYVFSASYDTSAISMTDGNTKTVAASVSSNCTVRYKSFDTSVATVSSAGKITAKKKGTANIMVTVSLSGKPVKTFTKKVTVKAASEAASSSSGSSSSKSSSSSSSSTSTSTSKSTSSSSSSGSSSGSSASKSSSGSSSSSSGSYDPSATASEYVISSSSLTVDVNQSRPGSVCVKNAKYANENVLSIVDGRDTFSWKCSSTSVVSISPDYSCCSITGKSKGTATVTCVVNGLVSYTCEVTVTDTDGDLQREYEAWRKSLENELWTSGMSCYDKILTLGNYVFARYPYNSSYDTAYGYMWGYGADCWGSSQLLVDVAHDLGLEAETYYTNGLTYGHRMARIHLDDGKIWVCGNSASGNGSYGNVYGYME